MARAIVPAADEIVDQYFPVLDHGFIALVDYMGDGQAIIDAARTSYGAGTRKVREGRALTRFLYRQRHTSPFEMVELKFHCKMPIVVARQWIRHRMANVNEYSGRYSLMPMQFYTPKREQLTTQSESNRQGRTDNKLQVEAYEDFVRHLKEMRATGQIFYEAALEQNIARELARNELPLSLYTEWYWKIDLHNLTHFLGLRCHDHAQWEVRQYANLMAGMVKRVAPDTFEAWLDYHPHMGGALLSRQELDALRFASDPSSLPPFKDLVMAHLATSGMSKRETDTFSSLLSESKPIPTFELDLTQAKSAEHFAELTRQYIPEVQGPSAGRDARDTDG